MNNYCVYRHRRLDTNKIFYIGIGSEKRAYRNSKYQRSKPWLNIINKTEYSVEILYTNLTLENAKELEVFLISLYGRRDLKKGNLVNLTDGGEGTVGRIISENHKQRIKETHLGKVISTESKKKMSDSKKLIYFLDKNPNSKKVINIETNEIFNTLKEAALSINMNYGTFKWAIRLKKNFNFKYLDK